MADIVTTRSGRDLQNFDPKRHRLTTAALDFGIEEARRIKDWPTLERAIDEKIKEQQKFVAWWDGAVKPGKGTRTDLNREHGFSLADAEDLTGMKQQRVSDLGKRLAKPDSYRERLLGAEYHAAMLEIATSQIVQQSLSNEHYTPHRYIEAATEVLGAIDLDPASCAEANDVVGATQFFTAEDNGLDRPWQGRVWLNPPYGRLVGAFIAKFMAECAAGRVTAGVVLVNAHCTDTEWFQPLWDGVLCFTDHRINFYGDDERSGSTHGSVFAYFGDDRERFADAFHEFGPIVARFAR